MISKSPRRFFDTVAIVTGAGNGIGLGIAHAFAAKGARVVVADINSASGERAVAEIRDRGGNAISTPTDVSDEAQVEALVQNVINRWGNIDVLVNNAGVVVHKSIVDLNRYEWDRQIGVQLTGPFLMSKHVAKHMISRNGPGRIINISSVSAVAGRLKGGAHSSAKAGLVMLTKVLAMELGEYQITVNAVAPGLVDVPSQRNEQNISTEYKKHYLEALPLGRLGEVSDIANMVLFLASPEANWITGQHFILDGGLMAGHYSFRGNHDFTLLDGH